MTCCYVHVTSLTVNVLIIKVLYCIYKEGGIDMFLAKPNVMVAPSAVSPVGIGLGACNSNNKCSGQSCDVNSKSSSSCGASLGVSIIGVGLSAASLAL